jgi:hypothetical protein
MRLANLLSSLTGLIIGAVIGCPSAEALGYYLFPTSDLRFTVARQLPTRFTQVRPMSMSSTEPGVLDFLDLYKVQAGGFVVALLRGDLGHFAAAFPEAGNDLDL